MMRPVTTIYWEPIGGPPTVVGMGRDQKSLARQIRRTAKKLMPELTWRQWLEKGRTFKVIHAFPTRETPILGSPVENPKSAAEVARKAMEDFRAYRAAIRPVRCSKAA